MMPNKKSILLFVMLLSSIVSLAQTGTIRGEVTNAISNEAIPFANVVVQSTGAGVSTDLDGKYEITDLAPGVYNLIVTSVGFQRKTVFEIEVTISRVAFVPIKLEEVTVEIEAAEVVAEQFSNREEAPVSVRTIGVNEVKRNPGGNRDISRALRSLPGVASTPSFRNDIIIRGGSPNENRFYIDGIEIPNINHFATQGSAGGPVGLLNVAFINDVTLSTSAFGSQYDNPLSGVLQFKQRDGNKERFNTNIRVSATDAAFTFEGPLFKSTKEESNTSFLLSIRRSYLQALFKLIGLPIRPDYWDYQYKLSHQIDEYNNLYFIGLGSVDDFTVEAPEDYDEEAQAVLEQAPFIKQKTNSIGVTWKKRFKDGSGYMETTLSNNRLENIFTNYLDPEKETGIIFRNDAVESETKLRHQLTKFLNDYCLK